MLHKYMRGYSASALEHYEFNNEGLADINGYEYYGALAKNIKKHGIDAFVSPAATGGAPRGLGHTGNPAMNLPWTHAGVPAITVPSGSVEAQGGELPLGLQLAAGYGEDEKLLAIAARLENRV